MLPADVIGIVTGIQLPKTACPRGKEHVSTFKEVMIKDLRYIIGIVINYQK
jgi:hypothetical protein